MLSLPFHGITLTVPEGALEPGFTEEIFLAVLTEGRDRPRLSPKQTLLSPVVLAGPPRLSFKKPVIFSFGHCADLKGSSNSSGSSWDLRGGSGTPWELGLYHCDSLFSDCDDTPWMKLATIGQESSSSVAVCLDRSSCVVMSDFLTRFCLVGQSNGEGQASKRLRVAIFGKSVNSNNDYSICVQVTEDTSVEYVNKSIERRGYVQLEEAKTFGFLDSSGDGLVLSLSDCEAGWSLRPKTQQVVTFDKVWSGGENAGSHYSYYSLMHVDPTVTAFRFKLSVFQSKHPESCLTFNVCLDAKTGTASSGRGSQRSHSSSISSDGQTRLLPPPSSRGGAQPLPPSLKFRLCEMLDSPLMGQNDWRALAAGFRLERFAAFFSTHQSPTECVLNLWAAHKGDGATTAEGSLVELNNLLRVIGRQDCAQIVEAEFQPWV